MAKFYRRNLPHYQPKQGNYFCTFRLANSLSKQMIKKYQQRNKLYKKASKNNTLTKQELFKLQFKAFDQLLDKLQGENFCLQKNKIAKIVANKIHELDQDKYDLISFCIMPNHVHLLIHLNAKGKTNSNATFQKYPLTKILKLIKGATAYYANQELNRKGQFWQHESYDHIVKDAEEMENIVKYILYNPVKAQLAHNWDDWKWSYCTTKFLAGLKL